jgi:hypothetical protein
VWQKGLLRLAPDEPAAQAAMPSTRKCLNTLQAKARSDSRSTTPLPMKLIDQVIELRVADNLTNTKSKTGYRKY